MAVRTPIIAIVGRANVGKSTLFNRVLKEKKAVVEDIPGVTRDRNYALVKRFEFPFYLVDTGGFDAKADDELSEYVRQQALLAAEEADIVLVVFDARSGCQPGDAEVIKELRSIDKPCFYIANKCDGVEQESLVADFYSLGVDTLHPLSALHGRRVDSFFAETLKSLKNYSSLLASANAQRALEEELAQSVRDAIVEAEKAAQEADSSLAWGEPNEEAPDAAEAESEKAAEFVPVFVPGDAQETAQNYLRSNRTLALGNLALAEEVEQEAIEDDSSVVEHIDCIRIALVGRPNVGKSTLLNTLSGEQRAITSDIAGTTRDALELQLTRDGQQYTIIDTAGLRKKARVSDTIERYSVMRSLRAITECDVAVVLIDALAGPSEQDARILGLAHEEGKGIVIAVNKWDLIEKNHRSVQEFKKKIREAFRFSPYAPMVFISALSGRRCPKVIETVHRVAYERSRMVPTARLNKILQRAMQKNSPPVSRGRRIRMYYATQVSNCPPRFIFFFNQPEAVHFSYLRYLKNCIREAWPFEGSDIKISCRKRKGSAGKNSRT